MTIQTPFQTDLIKGQSLLRDLSKEMSKLAAAKRTTNTRRADWRKKEAPSPMADSMSGMMFQNMLMGLLCQSLFGLPLFDGLQLADDTTRALGVLGTAAHHELTEGKEEKPKMDMSSMLSDMMLAAEGANIDAAEDAQKRHAQELAEIKQLLMAMMAMMLMQQRRADKDAEIVPDVLRAPQLARFKQNRHSLDCVKTMFAHQAGMIAPALRCA